jgi:hypothetical protein
MNKTSCGGLGAHYWWDSVPIISQSGWFWSEADPAPRIKEPDKSQSGGEVDSISGNIVNETITGTCIKMSRYSYQPRINEGKVNSFTLSVSVDTRNSSSLDDARPDRSGVGHVIE